MIDQPAKQDSETINVQLVQPDKQPVQESTEELSNEQPDTSARQVSKEDHETRAVQPVQAELFDNEDTVQKQNDNPEKEEDPIEVNKPTAPAQEKRFDQQKQNKDDSTKRKRTSEIDDARTDVTSDKSQESRDTNSIASHESIENEEEGSISNVPNNNSSELPSSEPDISDEVVSLSEQNLANIQEQDNFAKEDDAMNQCESMEADKNNQNDPCHKNSEIVSVTDETSEQSEQTESSEESATTCSIRDDFNEIDEPARKMLKVENADTTIMDLENVEFQIVQNSEVEGLQNAKEEILTEDDNNIVGIISELADFKDALEEDFTQPQNVDVKVKLEESGKIIYPIPSVRSVKKRKTTAPEIIDIDLATAFTDQEDMALHALDLLSPYDINFISSHMSRRTEKDIERRLDCNFFRKKSFLFAKVPSFLFGLTFTNNKLLKFRSLILVSEKSISNLICANKNCQHGPDIPELNLEYDGKSKLGMKLEVMVNFINENVPSRFALELTMTRERLDKLFHDSKLSFHRYGTSIGHLYTKKKRKETVSIKKTKECPMEVVNGMLQLSEEHEQYLIKIVSALGKTRWEMALSLMHEIFGKTKAPRWPDSKLVKMLSDRYLEYVDPDITLGDFTEAEDKCLLFLHKFFTQTMNGNAGLVWKAISRHMAGRSEEECRSRLLRGAKSKNDLSLDNLDLEDIQDDVPSIFYYNECHVFALTVTPKDEETKDMDIATRLQSEYRFVVAGTLDEIFILPCRETALRCSHQGLHSMSFTYNPTKPDSQFETYLKLTFVNECRRAGLMDKDLDTSFNFNDILYDGPGIHALIDSLSKTRFVVPRNHFLTVNRQEDAKVTGGKRGFCNEPIYRDI